MKYLKFTIQNFKGIQKLEFDLVGRNPISRVFTLVGLNESGKTTILEALSFFYDNIRVNEEVKLTKAIVDDIHELIPKSEKDNFNNTITLKAEIKIEEEDKRIIREFANKKGINVIRTDNVLFIELKFHFKDSIFQRKANIWTAIIYEYEKKDGPGRKAEKPLYDSNKEVWGELTNYVADNLLPSIIYYPNFLFDFPDKIFLQSSEGEHKEQVFYRNVIQDILNSLNRGLRIDDHILNKFTGEKKDNDAIDSVINKMSGQVTRLLTKNTFNVFSKLLENKQVIIKFPKKDVGEKIFLEIKLKQGDEEYYIRERSLGVRWFFTFLLFTQFRTFRDKNKQLIFLFDEPASNLHQTGQQRLLGAFEELVINTPASIIYSTHSHHLINPRWLESTYIVKNNALNYQDDRDYNLAMTDISIIRYRTFVSENPNQKDYFYPILEVLEYRPSNLENIPNVIMVEGKNDFYTLEYFNKIMGIGGKLHFIPGMSSSSLDNLIQLYYAWGRNFIILLDSDKEGELQKRRYAEKFCSNLRDRVYHLKDIDIKWNKKELEKVFENNDALKIQQSVFNSDTVFDKYKFNLALQELLINSSPCTVSDESKENLKMILDWLNNKISNSISILI